MATGAQQLVPSPPAREALLPEPLIEVDATHQAKALPLLGAVAVDVVELQGVRVSQRAELASLATPGATATVSCEGLGPSAGRPTLPYWREPSQGWRLGIWPYRCEPSQGWPRAISPCERVGRLGTGDNLDTNRCFQASTHARYCTGPFQGRIGSMVNCSSPRILASTVWVGLAARCRRMSSPLMRW